MCFLIIYVDIYIYVFHIHIINYNNLYIHINLSLAGVDKFIDWTSLNEYIISNYLQ